MRNKILALYITLPLFITLPLLVTGCAMSNSRVQSGPTKLGLYYIMGNSESMGFMELANLGLVPMVKSRAESINRVVMCKRNNPRAITICTSDVKVSTDLSPADAEEVLFAHAQQNWEKVPAGDQPRIDYLEIMPVMWVPGNVEEAKWFSEVIQKLAPRIAQELDVKPIVTNIGVGGIPVDKPDVMEAMIPGLKAALDCGGAWGYQAYSLDYSMDLKKEIWTSLRYRKAYDYFGQHHPDLLQLPLILTEGGVDRNGDADKDGWQARGDKDKYGLWLEWFDNQLKKDSYVRGVTLFKIGAPSIWKSFDLEPMVPWLHHHYMKQGSTFGDDFGKLENEKGLLDTFPSFETGK